MRQLKFATETTFQLEDVPNELKFVEQIAKQYAQTKEELEHFYLIGLKTVENLKLEYSENDYDKNILWAVRQTILIEAQTR